MSIARELEDLREVREEISRVNRAAGHVVFNPACTAIIDVMIDRLETELLDELFQRAE